MTRPSLRELAAVFFRYGNWTFGGGNATMAVLQTELLENKKWVDEETFALSFGIARLVPGTTVLAFAAGVGWQLRGWPGALTALLASTIPCSLMTALVTVLYAYWAHNRFVNTGLRGAMAAASGIMFASGWMLVRPYWRRATLVRVFLFAGGTTVLGLMSVSPLTIVLTAGVIGYLWPEREAA
jgi:chromate transporter